MGLLNILDIILLVCIRILSREVSNSRDRTALFTEKWNKDWNSQKKEYHKDS